MPKAEDYECPRCNYRTKQKGDMRKHLYKLNKMCANIKNLELTDDIRLEVLEFHKHHPRPIPTIIVPVSTHTSTSKPTDGKLVNNFNIMNNYLNTLDVPDKLLHYLDHVAKNLEDINDKVEKQYVECVRKFEEDKLKYPILLESHEFLNMFDTLVCVDKQKIEDMNVIYDTELNKIKIYCDDAWESYFPDEGMTRLVQILRTNYLNKYECYLYKKIFVDKDIGTYQLNSVKLKLQDYYRFLYIFGLHPYVYMEKSEYVLENYRYRNPDELSNYGMAVYDEIKENLEKVEINCTKRNVLDIIKRNHKKNIKHLNENILDLINVDSEFKHKILQLTVKGKLLFSTV